METFAFLFTLLIALNGVLSTKLCEDYKRPLKENTQVDAGSRKFMNCWGDEVEHGQSDLVLLIDKSGSMRQYGWNSAIDFVDALLTEVKVAFNATRIAIGTFATKHKVELNYLYEPTFGNHKCRFIRDFKSVTYTSGGMGVMTNMKGSLQDAHAIFAEMINNPNKHKLRTKANKVVMVLSDGYPNTEADGRTNWGVDLSNEVLRLRQIGFVEVYAIAVTPGSNEALMKNTIATDQSLYIYKPSFNDLTKLAKSIRGDPYEKDYETFRVLASECKEGCDYNADCGCNLKSGKFKCACRRGYYGTGEKKTSGSSCQPCPVDSYGKKAGFTTGCTACPANSGTSGATGKLEIADCTCKLGFTGNPSRGVPCTTVKCNPVNLINNGFIANAAECGRNEYGATCIFRCNAGFKLVGNDVLKCDHTGRFSGSLPQCVPLRCSAVSTVPTASYTVSCKGILDTSSNTYGVGDTCTYSCKDQYYHHNGTKTRECMHSEEWSGDPVVCKEIACPKVPKNHAKLITESPDVKCFEETTKVNEVCRFNCPSGYQFSGSRSVTCTKDVGAIGVWKAGSSQFVAPNCADIERPKFSKNDECQNGITITNETLPDKSYGLINFDAIGVTDNSGDEVVVVSSPPGYELGRSYQMNITKLRQPLVVTFTATDKSNNQATCRFLVEIKDLQPPTLLECPPANIINKTSKSKIRVAWNEPKYTDNCGSYNECKIDIIASTPSNSEFLQGSTTKVTYKAMDPSGNLNEKCIFNVIVKAPTCSPLPAPRNGMVAQSTETFATIACPRDVGLYPTEQIPFFYTCAGEQWSPYPPNPMAKQLVPDCISKTPPTGYNEQLNMMYSYTGDCSSVAAQMAVKTNLVMLCGGKCKIEDVKVNCGAANVVSRRKRRNAQQLTIKVTIKVTTTAEKAALDPQGDAMKQEMQNVVAPNVLKTLKSIPTQSIDSNIQGSPTAYATNTHSLTCAGIGEVFDATVTDVKQRCAGCMSGQFKNLATGLCEPCPKGTYQPKEGSTSCIPCPEGSTTVGDDVKNYTSCRKLCQAGEYSATGFAPCDTAPRGTYVEGIGKTSYTQCPTGTTTVTPGAKSQFDCGTNCQPGTYSDTGVEPCRPCERGTFQHETGRINCIDCPGLTWTYGEGADDSSKCIDINSCSSSPCMNAGHCIDLKLGFRCECKEGFWGHRCEKEVNDCSLKPCLNGGKCLDKFKGYMCICPAGATGKNCETLYGICQTGVCGANGQCTDLADNSYKCVCNDGYTGPFCETFVDACQSSPCKNDGVCESKGSDYTCRCKPGFSGKQCKININFCSSEPCLNGGECTDSKYGFICKCTAPYFGLQCETKTNMCQHTTCKHSVRCTDLGTDVKCSCLPGYGGKYCDTKLGSDFDIGFQNREAPTFSSVEGKYDLNQFSVAFWMRTSDLYNKGTPLSYANEVNGKVDDNALVIADYSDFDLTINNVTANLDFSANDGEWHHVAVTWSSGSGTWVAYKDGAEIKRSSAPFQQGKVIKKGGIFIIGEEQDEIGGSFTPTESFFGDMSQLNVWRRVLSSNEVYDLAMSCKHATGDVLAWADFSEQSHGSIVKTEPSLACDFTNDLREYQQLEGWQLPSGLRHVIATEYHNDAKACATRCSSSTYAARCRSFIHDKSSKRCTFYSKSLLIEGGDAEKSTQYDLYQFSCVKPLGLSDGRIANNKITASSSVSGSAPYYARLFNTPRSSSQTYAHWTPSDSSPYIQIDLGSNHKITGIATQGHYRPDISEFATHYTIQYKILPSTPWMTYASGSSLAANTDSQTIKRNEVFLYATIIRIKPTSNRRIAMRMEIYGCPHRPQGQPIARSDGNSCGSSTCLNGGTCIDLYQRYVCNCPKGFQGSRCEQVSACPNPDIPVYGELKSRSSTAAEVKCLAGYETSDSTKKSCVKGSWIGSKVTCKPKNDCSSAPCFANHCQELEAGYRCYCPAGYTLAADKHTCQDINECSVNNGGCSHGCVNTVGSFRCTCNSGYRLEGSLLCVDNDECDSGTHGCSQDCKNTLGSFKCLCKTGYTLNGDGKTCNQRTCPSIPNIAYGQVSRTAVRVTYSCNAGYQLNGPQVRDCLPDGQWSGTQPSCTRVNCGTIVGETAIISVPGTYYNNVARFSCPASYRLLGSSSRTCLQSGQWSNSHPRCAKSTCPTLSKPLNGQILGISTIAGSVARVKCDQGYRLVQKSLELRTCQSDGQWTGGNSAVVTCQLIDCGTPPSSPYLQITARGGTKYQAIATYTCSQSAGQRCLDGPSTRHCNADGQWSGKQPTCVASSCCKPTIPEHSKFYSDNRYSYGDKVYTQCNEGYVTGGTALRVCQTNGQWSGSQTTCTIANCGDPGTVTNGVRMMDKTTYQSTVSYFCDPSFKLVGSTKRVCQANGQWSGEATSCVRSTCGGYKRGTSGTISIGGGKQVCHWMIQVSEGKKVNIDFTSFNIGANDKVKIYDGTKYLEYVTFTSKRKPRAITSNTHFMRVIYVGEDDAGTGFTLSFKETRCGGHFDSEYGVVTSPGFPISYNPNDECFWTIHRQHENLQIAFTDFFLQRNPSDFVEVFEGPFQDNRMLLYKTYGYGKPLVEWADRWMWIHFKVDHIYQDVGFKGVYGVYNPPKLQ